jgi:23S rRNA (uracil1939-C5)-methyltransferase
VSLITVRTEKLTAGGAALAREESGRVVFVRGALADEVVTARLVSEKKDVAHADLVEVIDRSNDRVVAPCPQVEAGCGGCDWQHLAVAAQREARRSIVVESLRRTGRVPDPQVMLGPVVRDTGVRTTVRLGVDPDGRVGFRAARSHEVVPTHECLVAHPLVEDLLATLVLPGADEVTVRVGAATGERAVWWSPESVAAPAGLPSDVRVGPESVVHERVAGHLLQVSAGSFFQASLDAAEALVEVVRRVARPVIDALPDGATVVDAYSGVGLFGATVVPHRLRLVAVEGSRSSCADAEVNLAGRDATVVRCSVERWRPEPAALVIADPSRSGLGAQAVQRLVATGARAIVLVSCDPVALARDVSLLRATGHRLVSCEILDLFPHSHHVEAVSLFVSDIES